MSKVCRDLMLVLILAAMVTIAGGPALAREAAGTAAGDFQGPKLLPDCKAAFDLSPSARRAVGDTVLTFQAIILKDGTVGFVELMNDDRPYPGIEQAARESLRGWRYEPGKLGGVPVNAGVTIAVQFRGSSVASSTRPAVGWTGREMGGVMPPFDRIVFDGGREDDYFPQTGPQDYGYDTARDMPCTGKVGPGGCWYIPQNGHAVTSADTMPYADASGRAAR